MELQGLTMGKLLEILPVLGVQLGALCHALPVLSQCSTCHDASTATPVAVRIFPPVSRVTPICTTPHLHHYCTKKRIYNSSILRLYIVQNVEIKAIRPKLLFVVCLERRINVNITLLCLPCRC